MNKPTIAILVTLGWIAGLVATAFTLLALLAVIGGAASWMTVHV